MYFHLLRFPGQSVKKSLDGGQRVKANNNYQTVFHGQLTSTTLKKKKEILKVQPKQWKDQVKVSVICLTTLPVKL